MLNNSAKKGHLIGVCRYFNCLSAFILINKKYTKGVFIYIKNTSDTTIRHGNNSTHDHFR